MGKRRAPPNDLAEMLREARNAMGLSLRQVQEKTGIHFATIQQIESGRRTSTSPRNIALLARLYHLPLDEVMRKAGFAGQEAQIAGMAQLLAAEGVTPRELREILRAVKGRSPRGAKDRRRRSS